MDIRMSTFNFPLSRGDGTQSASQTIAFPREVVEVGVGITGYSATFEGEDHHLGRLTVEMNARIDDDDPTKVKVTGIFGLRDWSGNFDDPFSGNIQWALLADLVAVPTPSPGDARGDLIIIDAEITQAIQHFRSANHLPAAQVFPDNSIRFVADKPTVVRLYVDYDDGSTLPIIGSLSGELEVISSGGTITLAPLQTIVPRRDVSIDRGNGRHTLNFLIPENFCRGIVNLRASVFNNFAPDQFSRNFEREINFEAMPELPVLAIGIEYTGDDVIDGATPDELAAPELTDFEDVFEFTEKTFPIPAVAITNYNTMTYDEDMESDISEGCDKFGDLKDAVSDMRGDSDDIVYGMINSGVNTGSVGGCGGGGVGVGKIGSQATAAHEVGHALGRDHAPCDNVTRCAEPADQDGDYPNYSGFDSDSIGEYGFDSSTMFGRVLPPGTFHDFMGYSGNKWISSYTYKALMSRIPSDFGGAGAGGAAFMTIAGRAGILPPRQVDHGEWLPIKTPHLFIRAEIERDRTVHFHEAFHFDTRPRPHGPNKTDFTVELLDEEGKVLRSACLYSETSCCSCESGVGRWPVRIRQAISYHPDSRSLVLYEGEKEIYHKEVLLPPMLEVRCSGVEDRDANTFTVMWNAAPPLGCRMEDVWYIVQWQDALGTWRGCAPRTQENELVIPKRVFGRQKQITVRVLATSGIATSVAICQSDCQYPGPRGGEPMVLRLQGVPIKGSQSMPLPPLLRVIAQSSRGRSYSRSEIRWYDENGAEIGRGRSFDLRNLPRGQNLLSAAVLDRGQGSAYTQWLIQRDDADQFTLLRGTIGKKKSLEQNYDKEY